MQALTSGWSLHAYAGNVLVSLSFQNFFFFLEKAAQLKSCYDERIESLHLQQDKQLVSVRPPQQSEMHQSTRWLSAS